MAKQRISSADRLCFFFSYCARVHLLGSLIKQSADFWVNRKWSFLICLDATKFVLLSVLTLIETLPEHLIKRIVQ